MPRSATQTWVYAVERSSDHEGPELFHDADDAERYVAAAQLDVPVHQCLVMDRADAAELIANEAADSDEQAT